MRGARVAAAVGAAAVIALGCSACRDNLMGSPSGDAPAPSSVSSSELSGIESTLNGIESDMNSDGSP
ncbi:hypothetical protein AMES_6266 [Amycolatopsis mediterranei S699]|uniref:Lipoprotein n=2 Tax=Amycolatopsis mediterranei TaxID=33910 RepID=A0A0H3DBQ5_AMYMU|nr:hypothetical protein [Amycolatopsis mediterranei]ADJ48091.1 hypothetical protein AMED_6357 [Amycolatopsis mediterranei U32]AEK44992.1 hypothetical protein RAM_32595 [Amycolatopsis mediterranei S699]AFO79802.1 hypothetical protein AMES_6266 [Amycolatopsis mediterranei S699]AGT86930.1 hypothetical protein B737_6266 [Amycolatopsis mediterranei RB]KDO10576.1 hypothetical protein DV26_11845 [Amycolatopsis mediterranei]